METKNSTIGKYFRHKKKLTKNDSSFVAPYFPPERQRYWEQMSAKGLKLNKVWFGTFKTKNGGEYGGFYATEDIQPNDILMWVPRSCLVTAQNAWESPLKTIFEENPEYFFSGKTNEYYQTLQPILEQNPDYYCPFRNNTWEFRMLLVYCLYEHSKGKESEWFNMFENFPVFETATYWPDEFLNQIEDKASIRLAKIAKKNFEEEAKAIADIAKKYPTILKSEFFTYEKIKWMYISLFTRHDEVPLKYISICIIGEFFNHERVRVHDYKNTVNPEEEDITNTTGNIKGESYYSLNDEHAESTDGSYGSIELDSESDFDYEKELAEMKVEVDDKTKVDGQEEKKQEESKSDQSLELKIKEINDYLANNLNWGDSFTIFFVNQIVSYLAKLQSQFQEGKITLPDALKAITEVEASTSNFQREAWKHYTEVLSKDLEDIRLEQFEQLKRESEKLKEIPSRTFTDDQDWGKENLGLMSKEKFEKESQVYVFYGRMSNRYLLVNYGAALEYNKYDNVHFKFPYFKYLDANTWLIEKIKSFKMSKMIKLKARRRKFAMELLTFYKAINWKYQTNSVSELFYPQNLELELKALYSMKEQYENFLSSRKRSEAELNERLKDPKLDYREYFATVLNLEQQRGINFHLKAVLVLIEILKRLKGGAKLEEALLRVDDLETAEQYERNRNFFSNYMKLFSSIKE